MIKAILGFLRVLFTPSCWIQNDPYSKAWDTKLNQLLKEHKFEYVNEYEAKLGDMSVWIKNHPYASFNPYRPHCLRIRPKRITALRAMDEYIRDTTEFL